MNVSLDATSGMATSIEAFPQNAAILSKSKNDCSAKKLADNNVPANVPQVPNVTRWFGQLSMLKAFQKVERGMKLHVASQCHRLEELPRLYRLAHTLPVTVSLVMLGK